MKSSRSFPLAFVTGLLFIGFFFFYLRPVSDHDVWWHLASGRLIALTHRVPTQDVFSWTCPGSPWIDNYWLYQLFIYGVYVCGGIGLLIVYKACITLFIFWPVYQRLRMRSLHGVWTSIGLWLAFWGSLLSSSGSERASLITLLGISWLFWHFDRLHLQPERPHRLWLWPFLFIVWANLHPGFAVGLVLAGVLALGEVWDSPRHYRRWGLWLMLCALATLITPYGFKTYRILYHGAVRVERISEWQHTPLQHMKLFWIIWIGFWGMALSSGRIREHPFIPLGCVAVACVLGVESVLHVLYMPFFVLFAVPWLMEWTSVHSLTAPLNRIWHERSTWTAGTAVLLATLFASLCAAGIRGGIDIHAFPVEACRFIDHAHIPGPFYNSQPFGGYWIWHFAGRRPVFIDGRYPTVDGYIPLREAIFKAQQGTPQEWQNFLSKEKVRSVLLDHPDLAQPGSIYSLYFPPPDWKRLYQDKVAVIYVRS